MNPELYNIQLYSTLTKLQTSEVIKKKLDELKKVYAVKCFDNKIKFLSKNDECMICRETAILIPRECTHYYCIDCYVKLVKCALCDN